MALFGLVIGVLFGFALQKGAVVKYDKQIGAMQFKDMTIFRFMMTTMLVGMIGLWIASAIGLISFTHEPFSVFGVIVGGLIFGIGWAMVGYCPGTAGGALGEGNLDALSAILGFIVAGVAYALFFPTLSELYSSTIISKEGFAEFLNIPSFVVILIFSVLFFLIFRYWEKKDI